MSADITKQIQIELYGSVAALRNFLPVHSVQVGFVSCKMSQATHTRTIKWQTHLNHPWTCLIFFL